MVLLHGHVAVNFILVAVQVLDDEADNVVPSSSVHLLVQQYQPLLALGCSRWVGRARRWRRSGVRWQSYLCRCLRGRLCQRGRRLLYSGMSVASRITDQPTLWGAL